MPFADYFYGRYLTYVRAWLRPLNKLYSKMRNRLIRFWTLTLHTPPPPPSPLNPYKPHLPTTPSQKPSLDIYFWYDVSFGSPLARAQGIGYVQELVARLTHTPIATHNSSTNATLDDSDVTFPLADALYVDATHETVVLNSMCFFLCLGVGVWGGWEVDDGFCI